jgi:hypothetical protein
VFREELGEVEGIQIVRLLTRQGFLIEEQDRTYIAEADTGGALLPLQAASCTYRIALGPRAGQKVLSLQSAPRNTFVSN